MLRNLHNYDIMYIMKNNLIDKKEILSLDNRGIQSSFNEYVCEYEKRSKRTKTKFLIHRARVGDCVLLNVDQNKMPYLPKRWYVLNDKNEIIPEGLGVFSVDFEDFDSIYKLEEKLIELCREIYVHLGFATMVDNMRLLNCFDLNNKVYRQRQEDSQILNWAVKLAYNQNKNVYLGRGLSSGGAGYLYDYNSRYMKYYEYGEVLSHIISQGAKFEICPVITLKETTAIYIGNGTKKRPYKIFEGSYEEYYQEWNRIQYF